MKGKDLILPVRWPHLETPDRFAYVYLRDAKGQVVAVGFQSLDDEVAEFVACAMNHHTELTTMLAELINSIADSSDELALESEYTPLMLVADRANKLLERIAREKHGHAATQ